MSHIEIKIETDNSAFVDQGGIGHEVARILRQLANNIEFGAEDTSIGLLDVNGNRVGSYHHFHD